VLLPNLRDARLHVAATLLTVQVLGQTVIDWDLSIAQILLSLGTCAVLEAAFVFWRRREIAWPASALLTGNGVALLLRVPGTEHGDWWSLHGANVFVATAGLSVMSKYLVRADDRPLFNPSNVGLVLCFLYLGSTQVEPQDFWWGPWSPGLALTYLVILAGGLLITRRLGLLGAALAFWAALAAGLGVVALSGHAITATWHVGLLTDWSYWWVVVASPETLIFLFFMITDPRTTPRGPAARVVFGGCVGLLAAGLAAPQRTEFGTKVAVLAALTVVCLARPLLERAVGDLTARDLARCWAAGARRPARLVGAVAALAALVLALVLAGTNSRELLPANRDLGARPEGIAIGTVPPVGVAPSVDELSTRYSQDDADRMARDLLEDLAIEAEALRTGDADLAATASTGTRLEAVRDAIAAGDTSGVAVYDLQDLTLFLHRELAAGQAAPRLGLAVEGSRRTAASASDRTPGDDEAFAAVFLLEQVEGHWLIEDQRDPVEVR